MSEFPSRPEPVSHDEARDILSRFNASHWRDGREKARYTIPCDPNRDDDCLMDQYIREQRLRDIELAQLRELVTREAPDKDCLMAVLLWLATNQNRFGDTEGHGLHRSHLENCIAWLAKQNQQVTQLREAVMVLAEAIQAVPELITEAIDANPTAKAAIEAARST